MKSIQLLIAVSIAILISSCKQRVYLTVSEPPAVHLNDKLKNATLINRSFTKGAFQVFDRIDNALTLEGKLDKKGAKVAIDGVLSEMVVNPQFNRIKVIDSLAVENRVSSEFPAPMDWQQINSICFANESDFLMVLEVYDTDTKINYSSKMENKSTPLGNVTVPVHYANMVTRIQTGCRIYDPFQRLILDEFYLEDQLISTGNGINPVTAAAALLNREQAVKQISTQVGQFYIGRVVPQRFRVWRNYYNKGSRTLKMANRRAEAGDWDGAAELWKKELAHPKRKVAGRAHYNMAIYHEIIGDLYKALSFAQKAYADYRIKEGLTYSNILRDRINRIERSKTLTNGQ